MKAFLFPCLIFLLWLPVLAFSQNTVYHQFWNEFQLTHPIADKFAIEVDLANNFSDTPEDKSIFSTHTQFSSVFMLNYYYTAKWRFSLMSAYFSNYSVPEIGQRQYPEYRTTAQANYFFKKIGYILQTRTRIEYRLIKNTEGKFEDVLRYRQQLKYTQPFNSKFIRQGTYFGFVSDEVFFKTPSNISGQDIFDRNMLTLALGYAISDNIQIDLDYTFEYAPRKDVDISTYAIQLNFTINNPFTSLYDTMKKK